MVLLRDPFLTCCYLFYRGFVTKELQFTIYNLLVTHLNHEFPNYFTSSYINLASYHITFTNCSRIITSAIYFCELLFYFTNVAWFNEVIFCFFAIQCLFQSLMWLGRKTLYKTKKHCKIVKIETLTEKMVMYIQHFVFWKSIVIFHIVFI